MSEKKSPLEQALDLFFYAPLGLVLGADEVIPQLIERGRQQATVARMFGQFAVQQGQSEAGKAIAKVQEQLASRGPDNRRPGDAGPTTASPRPSVAEGATATARTPTRAARSDGRGAAPEQAPSSDGLAIPDYDSLSASQVVPRLAGLSRDELEAVRAYESAKRGRKTILSKVAQLQG